IELYIRRLLYLTQLVVYFSIILVDYFSIIIYNYLDISVRSFEQMIGASNGLIRKAISTKSDIQSKWIINIVDNFPQLNSDWLLTGKGEMINDKSIKIKGDRNIANTGHIGGDIVNESEVSYGNEKTLIQEIEQLKKTIQEKNDLLKAKDDLLKAKDEIIQLLRK
ncbi:MAG: hypothetical protein E6767_05300, partial [Dysgonomonas sp.]|nr:hypothetical protein [Dysgonomonas sp.]